MNNYLLIYDDYTQISLNRY